MLKAGADNLPRCDFSEETITVLVGSIQKSFKVHPTILINNSLYFRSMLASGNFKEAHEKVARLSTVEPALFQVYVTYIYSGDFSITQQGTNEEWTDENDPDGTTRFHVLVKLYALADYLQDLCLKNKIIDSMIDPTQNIGNGTSIMSVELAFETTPANSALCRLIVDTNLSCCNPETLEKDWDSLPEAYIRALTIGKFLYPHDRMTQ